MSYAPLTGPSLPPEAGGEPRQLAILLHGVGADGQDLIGLAPYFARVLPHAEFLAPNAPAPCDMAPFGYQWFSLQNFDENTRLRGCREVAPVVNEFIDAELAKRNLTDDRLVLIGFSQGTMTALHVALRRAKPVAGILAFSGMLCGEDVLASEIKSRPPVLMIHGEMDEVLPIQCHAPAVAALKRVGVPVTHTTRPNLGHGIDEECLILGMRFLKEIFGEDAA